MSLPKKQLLGCLLFSAVMCGMAWFYYQGVISLVKTDNWVAHTHRVIGFGNLIQKLLVDMETGERGFLITGKENFLEPYHEGKQEYAIVMAHAQELVEDNPEQLKRLRQADALVQKWLRVAAQPEIQVRIDVNKATASIETVQALIENETGKAVMDELRAHLAEFINTENRLLATRRDDSKKAARQSVQVTILGTLLGLVIGYASILFAGKDAGERPRPKPAQRQTHVIRKYAVAPAGIAPPQDQAPAPQTAATRNTRPLLIFSSLFLLLLSGTVALMFYRPEKRVDINAGEGYGFQIGHDKTEIFERIVAWRDGEKVYGLRVGNPNNRDEIITDLSQNTFQILKYYDEWYVELNSKRIGMDTLHLIFSDNKLANSHKHYQMVILPSFMQQFDYLDK